MRNYWSVTNTYLTKPILLTECHQIADASVKDSSKESSAQFLSTREAPQRCCRSKTLLGELAIRVFASISCPTLLMTATLLHFTANLDIRQAVRQRSRDSQWSVQSEWTRRRGVAAGGGSAATRLPRTHSRARRRRSLLRFSKETSVGAKDAYAGMKITFGSNLHTAPESFPTWTNLPSSTLLPCF